MGGSSRIGTVYATRWRRRRSGALTISGSNGCASKRRSWRRRRGDAALAEIDLAAALQKCEADAALRARVADLVRTVQDKLPGGMAEDASVALDLDSILAEARALALGRTAEA